MKYKLDIAIFNRQMGNIPIVVSVGIPPELARAIMNVNVTYTKLLISEDLALTTIPLLNYNTEKIEKETKDRNIDGKGKVIDG